MIDFRTAILNQPWSGDGTYIVLLHAFDLSSFYNRAKYWLRSSVEMENYLMRFITERGAEKIVETVSGIVKKMPQGGDFILINFKHEHDAALFQIALSGAKP